jgi:hypothetical protein
MMTCPGNLSNILKIVTKSKPLGKCSNMIFNFFCANPMTFFSEKKSDQIFPFHKKKISHLFKFSNPKKLIKKKKKKLIMSCVFEFFQSHCHILKELHEFFCMMTAITNFRKKIVSYLVLWIMNWWQSHLGLGAHLTRWQRKTKCQKMNVNFLQPN